MAENNQGGALIAAALIVGASVVGASYLVSTSIDRGAAELATLKSAAQNAANSAQVAQRPSPARPRRPDPARVYQVDVASAPIKGNASAAITIVEWVDFQ